MSHSSKKNKSLLIVNRKLINLSILGTGHKFGGKENLFLHFLQLNLNTNMI